MGSRARSGLSLCAAASAAALAGCGFGPGAQQRGAATLTITRGFGEHRLASASVSKLTASDTVMRLVASRHRIQTRYGGNYVQAIDGLAGSLSARRDWFYYVDGREAPVGAGDYGVHPGDRVQWDYHRWDATIHVPQIVGAYPLPFARSTSGRRPATVVECASPGAACATATRALRSAGAAVTTAPLGSKPPADAVLMVVGPWARVRSVGPLRAIESGPAASGVFARFDATGRTLTLLDGGGHPALVAPPGSGLLAATAGPDGTPTWVASGADGTGVERAAAGLGGNLTDLFAVAFTPGASRPLPIGGAP